MIGLAFFVYRRPNLTEKVIESIKRNHFEKIYIFQDGLKKEEDRKEWEQVSELIKGIDFTETEIHISDHNKGLANSIIGGMNYVFERHECAIALEDDVLLADGYKDFMEHAFEKYKDNMQVWGVCGSGWGQIIPDDYTYDIFFSYRMSSVAFGTWKNRWIGFKRDPYILGRILKNPEKKKMLEMAGNDLEPMVIGSIKNNLDTWATYWCLYQVEQTAFCVIPVKAYAKDLGRIGGGTNTIIGTHKYDDNFAGKKQEIYNMPADVILNDKIVEDVLSIMHVDSNRLECYYEIFCKWMTLYQNNKSTSDYFEKNGINKIYIYGTAKMAEYLYNDIKGKVDVVGFLIEQKKEESFKGHQVQEIRDDLKLESVPIVITPTFALNYITHLFKKNGIENRMIPLDEVVAIN